MDEESEKDPLTPSKASKSRKYRDYLLGVFHAVCSAFLNATSSLMLKNIHNSKGKNLRYEETLIARAIVFLPVAIIFMLVKNVSLFGLKNKTYLILNMVGLFATMMIHSYNVSFYSMTVGDVHTISFFSIISIMVLERIFRGKQVSIWKCVFSMGVIVGGALVAQPTLDIPNIHNQGHNSTLLIEEDDPATNILTSRLVGLLIVFMGFNSEAILTICLSLVNETSSSLVFLHIGIWKLIFFPLSQLLLPSPGRLLTSEVVDFIQYDLTYHCATSLCMLAAWVFYIFSLQKISPIVFTVIHCISLLFDYGGQAVIDGTTPNSMASFGIFLTTCSVILFVLEKIIFKTEDHLELSQ